MNHEDRFDIRPGKRVRLPIKPEESNGATLGHFPSWLHRKLPKSRHGSTTFTVIAENDLHTVCEEAKCPNIAECYGKKTATFLLMGKECTRACSFCDIAHKKNPDPIDPQEVDRVVESVISLGLVHVVLTVTARDDLPDQGAYHIIKVVQTLRKKIPHVTIELLTSDFNGNIATLESVLNEHPEVFNHNIETTRALTPKIRHTATYDTSIKILTHAAFYAPQVLVKSGIMVGLGESEKDVVETLKDLKKAGCRIVTIGQYLQASKRKFPVQAFIHPETFEKYSTIGKDLGIPYMYCGPFIRSSYNADLFIQPQHTQ